MGDILGKVIAIFLCVYLMFFYPLVAAREEREQLMRSYLYMETVNFIDSIRNTGVIKEKDLQHYLDEVAGSGKNFKVKITHRGMDVSEGERREVYFYNREIYEKIEADTYYQMDYGDFIKIVLENGQGNMVLCYGGSIKAVEETDEDIDRNVTEEV